MVFPTRPSSDLIIKLHFWLRSIFIIERYLVMLNGPGSLESVAVLKHHNNTMDVSKVRTTIWWLRFGELPVEPDSICYIICSSGFGSSNRTSAALTTLSSLVRPPRSSTTVPSPLSALQSRCFPLLPRNFSILSHFSLVFLACFSFFCLSLSTLYSTSHPLNRKPLSNSHRCWSTSRPQGVLYLQVQVMCCRSLHCLWAAELAIRGEGSG